MTLKHQNFEMVEQDDIVLQFTVKNNAGAVVDVSGWSVAFNMAKNDGDSPLFTKAGSVTDGPNGIIEVAIDAADTADFIEGTYRYQVSVTDTGSKVRTVAMGDMRIYYRIN